MGPASPALGSPALPAQDTVPRGPGTTGSQCRHTDTVTCNPRPPDSPRERGSEPEAQQALGQGGPGAGSLRRIQDPGATGLAGNTRPPQGPPGSCSPLRLSPAPPPTQLPPRPLDPRQRSGRAVAGSASGARRRCNARTTAPPGLQGPGPKADHQAGGPQAQSAEPSMRQRGHRPSQGRWATTKTLSSFPRGAKAQPKGLRHPLPQPRRARALSPQGPARYATGPSGGRPLRSQPGLGSGHGPRDRSSSAADPTLGLPSGWAGAALLEKQP